MTQLVL